MGCWIKGDAVRGRLDWGFVGFFELTTQRKKHRFVVTQAILAYPMVLNSVASSQIALRRRSFGLELLAPRGDDTVGNFYRTRTRWIAEEQLDVYGIYAHMRTFCTYLPWPFKACLEPIRGRARRRPLRRRCKKCGHKCGSSFFFFLMEFES